MKIKKNSTNNTEIKKNSTSVVSLLQSALADEWLAHYQYWIGSKIAVGPLRPSIIAEFEEHAKEEYNHANKLANRILELGGELITNPKNWNSLSHCGYQEPTIPNVIDLLKNNIDGEKCAIEVYKNIIQVSATSDPTTYYIALEILKEEEAHKFELQGLLDDIEYQNRLLLRR